MNVLNVMIMQDDQYDWQWSPGNDRVLTEQGWQYITVCDFCERPAVYVFKVC